MKTYINIINMYDPTVVICSPYMKYLPRVGDSIILEDESEFLVAKVEHLVAGDSSEYATVRVYIIPRGEK